MRRVLVTVVSMLGLAVAPAPALAIVGGADVPEGKFPATASVTISGAFGCTGTLIAPDWVLTAGHCSSITGGAGIALPIAMPPSSFAVTVGTNKANGTGGEQLAVDRVVVSGSYFLTQGNDTSLLHLAAPAKTTPTPVAGTGYDPLFAPGVLTDVVGFGVTAEGGDAPPLLQEVAIPVLPDATCGATYGSSYETDTQLCGGYAEGGKDSCQGDSGGPMYARTVADRLFVVGAVSYGDGCARPGTPGVYARTSAQSLREFIRSNAPAAVVDLAPGASATPLRTYDAGTKAITTNKPAGSAPAPSGTPATAKLTASLATDRTRRSTFRARGLRFRLGCSAACSTTVSLRLDAASARALGRSRTLGTKAVRRTSAGRSTVLVKLPAALARRVTARRSAKLQLVTSVAGRTLTRTVTLTGR